MSDTQSWYPVTNHCLPLNAAACWTSGRCRGDAQERSCRKLLARCKSCDRALKVHHCVLFVPEWCKLNKDRLNLELCAWYLLRLPMVAWEKATILFNRKFSLWIRFHNVVRTFSGHYFDSQSCPRGIHCCHVAAAS